MFSERWEKSEPISIETYSYEDFKEFLSFFYIGTCHLTHDNIFLILDLAEMYQVEYLKKECDDFLSKMDIDKDHNVFKFCELLEMYHLEKLKSSMNKYFSENFETFMETYDLKDASKNFMLGFASLKRDEAMESKMFEKVSLWTV